MHFPTILVSSLLGAVASAQTVYLIRHGEKPSDGGNGLSAQGVERAQCLRTVFGANSGYNVQYIIAEKPKKSGARGRPLETVQPLAADLSLTVDTSCDRDDSSCVVNLVKAFRAGGASGNILICWEHGQLTNIVQSLGDNNAPTYPDSSFNIIWTDPAPYTTITSMTSENCQGLDN